LLRLDLPRFGICQPVRCIVLAIALGHATLGWACSSSTSPATSDPSLCDVLCRKTTACQVNGSLEVCTRQCQSNQADVSAMGCGSELRTFHGCMLDNIVCKDGDFDIVHIAQACRMSSDALTACERRDGSPEGG
jgi:hypothetical protein